MSEIQAAAILAAAALAKTVVPQDGDAAQETIRLYRRMRNAVRRIEEEKKLPLDKREGAADDD